jgi:hypothetical protein
MTTYTALEMSWKKDAMAYLRYEPAFVWKHGGKQRKTAAGKFVHRQITSRTHGSVGTMQRNGTYCMFCHPCCELFLGAVCNLQAKLSVFVHSLLVFNLHNSLCKHTSRWKCHLWRKTWNRLHFKQERQHIIQIFNSVFHTLLTHTKLTTVLNLFSTFHSSGLR